MPVRPIWILAALALVASPAWPLPTPGADDAATGTDAADSVLFATPIGPGQHAGRLSGDLDGVDAYALSPPLGAIVRVGMTASGPLTLRVFDAGGRIRGCSDAAPAADVSAVADPGGRWLVQLDTGPCGTPLDDVPAFPWVVPPIPPTTYVVTVAFETHDHVAAIVAPLAPARTINASFPEGSFARLELLYSPGGDVLTPSALAFASRVHEVGGATSDAGGLVTFRSSAGISKPSAWIHAEGVVDLQVALPPLLLPDRPFGVVAEGAGPATWLDIGVAHSGGIGVRGWAVWDGPSFPVTLPPGDAAVFAPLRAFDAEGVGFQGGPYVHMTRGTASFEAGPGERFIFVDAALPLLDPLLPPLSLAATRFEIVKPSGDTLTLADDAVVFFGADAEVGTWTVEARDVDGLWGDNLVFVGVRFPFPEP